jgi:hypothetical protein
MTYSLIVHIDLHFRMYDFSSGKRKIHFNVGVGLLCLLNGNHLHLRD